MIQREVLTAILVEETQLTLEDVACAGAVSVDWIASRVSEGAIQCRGCSREAWRFGSHDLTRVRRIHALERDFDAGPELAALVADMLDEIDLLRARLRRAGLD